MPFDAESAKKAGYSDTEIADYLAKQSNFDADAARKAGYGDSEIVAHLTGGGAPAEVNLPGADAYTARHADHSIARTVDAAGRGAADMLSFGFGDEASAAANAVPALFKGGADAYGKAYQSNVADERAIDAADKQDHPIARGVGEVGGFLGGLGAGAVADVGRFVPRIASAARGAPAMLENALRSAGAGAAYSGLSAAGNGEGNLGQRAQEAIPAAVLGAGVGAVAAPLAEVAGAGINALRTRGAEPLDRAANALAGRFDVGAAQARAADLRAAGADPAAVSAMDESGRGFVRAAASRMTPARELVQQRAEGAAMNLPDRIGMQARDHLSADPRTPDQIATDLAQARGTTANANFGAVRGDTISMAPETVQALRNPLGRSAIADAAQRERDPTVRAALNRLATDALDDPSTQITVGMADRISRTLYGRSQAAARSGDNDLAATFSSLGDAVRSPARAASSGYDAALGGYADQSRIMDAAGQGEDFLKRNTDEFVAQTPGPGDPGNDLARATARRAVERAAGENVSAAPGVARKLAFAPEQQARNNALLGTDAAQGFQNSMAAEARTVRDMQDVAPRTGSQTQLRSADADAASGALSAAATLAGGPKAWGEALLSHLRTAGVPDATAQAVADIATDPTRLNELLQRMEQIHPGSSQALSSIINQSVGKDAGEITQPKPAIEVQVNKSTNPDFLAQRRLQGASN